MLFFHRFSQNSNSFFGESSADVGVITRMLDFNLDSYAWKNNILIIPLVSKSKLQLYPNPRGSYEQPIKKSIKFPLTLHKSDY